LGFEQELDHSSQAPELSPNTVDLTEDPMFEVGIARTVHVDREDLLLALSLIQGRCIDGHPLNSHGA